jgi:acyl phosphate:glycerol-3-phosphate acyltransferase
MIMEPITGLGLALFAYLCGAIPTGYWLGKMLRDIDIREHGSRSTGATNVLRLLGKWPAFTTVVIDLAKGYIAVSAVRWFCESHPFGSPVSPVLDASTVVSWAMAIAALFAILGHARSILIGFTGGKSAATGLGVLLAQSWEVGLGVGVVFVMILAVTRIVSLSSIIAAVSAIALAIFLDQSAAFICLTVIGAIYVVARHRNNIRRMLIGSEPRLGQANATDGR